MTTPNRKPLAVPPTPSIKTTPEELASYIAALGRASKHRAALETAGQCACFFCFKKFATSSIKSWVDAHQTALCPFCGIDAVLGAGDGVRIDDRFLRRLHQHHFATRAK
jgi:hypothetical protein